jgi:4-hydroxy-3-polyprenylbenzoate decarboxylase
MVPEIKDMLMPVEGVFHNLVIASIHKEYAGQGQKVMNAMWGAGQMMFNKILVLTDGDTKLDNYKKLAQYVFNNINPTTDVYFSQGPMDVLDHSCSKMGFGGKMCIDGTKKWEEEQTIPLLPFKLSNDFSAKDVTSAFPEITGINCSLVTDYEIPVLFIAVHKNKEKHIETLHESITALKGVEGIKMLLYVEHTVNINNITDVLWRFCNNLDPRRDHHYGGKNKNILGLDGTMKTKIYDGFERPWPNIIVADDATIEAVDKKWKDFNFNSLIISPSLQYKTQLYRGGASVLEND